MDKAVLNIKMAIYIQEIGKKIKKMEKDCFKWQMEVNMMDIGKIINLTEKEN